MTTYQQILSRLSVIRARADAATEGPWTKSQSFAGATVYAGSPTTGARGLVASFDSGDYARSKEEGHANAELCAHSRTDVSALCDAVEKALAALDNANELKFNPKLSVDYDVAFETILTSLPK